MEHISIEPVRSYLLGILEESSAASIEERYFTDRQFFRFVQAAETALVEDYLAGRLAPDAEAHFKARYLTAPDLKRRFEEVQSARAVISQRVRPIPARRLRLAAVFVLCAASVAVWFQYLRPQNPAAPVTPLRPVVATISLSPGVFKGSGKEADPFIPTGKVGTVQFVLELPGQVREVPCSATISRVEPNGSWRKIWSSPEILRSRPITGGQQLTVGVDSSLFVRGDYMIEATTAGGDVHEAYFLRVPSPM